MALDDLVGSNAQNGPMGNMFFGNANLNPSLGQPLGPYDQHPGFLGNPNPLGGGLATLPEGHLPPQLPQLPHFGNFTGLPHGGPHLQQPDYSGQFEKFGEQLGGLGEQMTGYQDALGSFNEQMGGMGKQFETVNNKLDSMEKGIASLDQQLQARQQQQAQRPQPRPFNPFSPFGFGGLGSLFMRRY